MLCDAYRQQVGRSFISTMPTNLYGPNDNFDPFVSHVVAATIHKIVVARNAGRNRVTMWGSGSPLREAEIGFAILAERRRHTDDDHVRFDISREVHGGLKPCLCKRSSTSALASTSSTDGSRQWQSHRIATVRRR
nr:NAD-dependent epimerase/dehydratase family protein [Mesorhizobium onobrychidis]